MDWSARWRDFRNRDVSPGDEIKLLFVGFLLLDLLVLIPYWLWRKTRPTEFDQYSARRPLRFHREEPQRDRGELSDYAARTTE